MDDVAAVRTLAHQRFEQERQQQISHASAAAAVMTATWNVRTSAEDVMANADRQVGVTDRAAHVAAAYEALNAIVKLLENIARNPTNERYRTLRTTNDRLQQNMYVVL
jgi:hypothetical protein